jgi:hypothetical protein
LRTRIFNVVSGLNGTAGADGLGGAQFVGFKGPQFIGSCASTEREGKIIRLPNVSPVFFRKSRRESFNFSFCLLLFGPLVLSLGAMITLLPFTHLPQWNFWKPQRIFAAHWRYGKLGMVGSTP